MFLNICSKCQANIHEAHTGYTNNIVSLDEPLDKDKTKATKRFSNYVKSKKNDSCNTAPLRSNWVLISNAAGKANIPKYCYVFIKENKENLPSKRESNISSLPNITVDYKGVEKLLYGLNPEKAADSDKKSPKVLKKLSGVLSKPLSIIFQHSIDSGIIPTQWKSGLVTPTFKKGNKQSAAHYCHVSLNAVCCKTCEHIIAKAVIKHLETKGLLSDFQHGLL